MIRRSLYLLKIITLAVLIFLFGLNFSLAQRVPTPEEILGFKV